MKLRRIVVLPLLVIGLIAITFFIIDKSTSTGSLPDYPTSPIPGELRRMDTANAEADLASAIRKTDFRFIGLYGVGISVPGVNERCVYYCVEHRGWLKMIEGTSDAITSKEQERLQLLAEKYANQYNANLFEYLKENKLLPKELR
jgi:hypothetical protein